MRTTLLRPTSACALPGAAMFVVAAQPAPMGPRVRREAVALSPSAGGQQVPQRVTERDRTRVVAETATVLGACRCVCFLGTAAVDSERAAQRRPLERSRRPLPGRKDRR